MDEARSFLLFPFKVGAAALGLGFFSFGFVVVTVSNALEMGRLRLIGQNSPEDGCYEYRRFYREQTL